VASWVWLDGRLVEAGVPHLDVSDRGFQLGDGIFETARSQRGVVIELDEHLARLRESAAALAIPIGLDDAALAHGIADLLAAEGLAGNGSDGIEPGGAALRITVSRGPLARRGLLPAGFEDAHPTIVIQAWPYAPPPTQLLARGVQAIPSAVRRDTRSPLAGIKSTSRADHVYARLEADRAGVDDAVFLTTDGAISEATSANVWIVTGAKLATPSLSSAVLQGTTRTWLLAYAARIGLEATEAEIRPEDLLAADEAFLSSSVAGIVPLTGYDHRPIGSGNPGRWSTTVREAREEWIEGVSLAGRR